MPIVKMLIKKGVKYFIFIQNVSGTLLGTLTAGTGIKLVGTGKYCTHSTPIGGSSATWTFTWVAPAAGTGIMKVYCQIPEAVS